MCVVYSQTLLAPIRLASVRATPDVNIWAGLARIVRGSKMQRCPGRRLSEVHMRRAFGQRDISARATTFSDAQTSIDCVPMHRQRVTSTLLLPCIAVASDASAAALRTALSGPGRCEVIWCVFWGRDQNNDAQHDLAMARGQTICRVIRPMSVVLHREVSGQAGIGEHGRTSCLGFLPTRPDKCHTKCSTEWQRLPSGSFGPLLQPWLVA